MPISAQSSSSEPIRHFQHNGGTLIVACRVCNTYLTNDSELISTRFQGSSGKASLYYRVWNITCSEKQTRDMMTGKHIVRDVMCMNCSQQLGWMYEYAMNDDQKYKEQRVILENKLVTEMEGIRDPEYGYNGPYRLVTNEHRGSPEAIVSEEPIPTERRIIFSRKPKT